MVAKKNSSPGKRRRLYEDPSVNNSTENIPASNRLKDFRIAGKEA